MHDSRLTVFLESCIVYRASFFNLQIRSDLIILHLHFLNCCWMSLKITDWAAEDRPREKLILKGTASLSDAELLAILISFRDKKQVGR